MSAILFSWLPEWDSASTKTINKSKTRIGNRYYLISLNLAQKPTAICGSRFYCGAWEVKAEPSLWFNWQDEEQLLYWSTWRVAVDRLRSPFIDPTQWVQRPWGGQANVKGILPLLCKVESHSAGGEAEEGEGGSTIQSLLRPCLFDP